MTNIKILEIFLKIQEKTMFSKIVDFKDAKIITNESDKTPFWNYVLCDNDLSVDRRVELEKQLDIQERKRSFYFENDDSEKTVSFIEELTRDGYALNNEDSWMFFDSNKIEDKDYSCIKKVSTIEDLKVWISTINECYKKDDPQNPYGDLGAYLELAEIAWMKNNSSDFIYYIAHKDTIPVAVATLTFESDLSYISNVGSLQAVRGQGYGKLITLFCVDESFKRGIKNVCLATEEGTFPNNFYKRIGFQTKFTAKNYTKN